MTESIIFNGGSKEKIMSYNDGSVSSDGNLYIWFGLGGLGGFLLLALFGVNLDYILIYIILLLLFKEMM
jgi:hypothetical protein